MIDGNHLNGEQWETSACICESVKKRPYKNPQGKVDVEVGEGDEDGDQRVRGSARWLTLALVTWLFCSRHNLN